MKTPTAILALLLATTTLTFVPSADAVGTCSELKQSWCDGYLLCVGYVRDSYGFRCTGIGIPNPFEPCTCPPIQAAVNSGLLA